MKQKLELLFAALALVLPMLRVGAALTIKTLTVHHT